jgi:hypothetical protein
MLYVGPQHCSILEGENTHKTKTILMCLRLCYVRIARLGAWISNEGCGRGRISRKFISYESYGPFLQIRSFY